MIIFPSKKSYPPYICKKTETSTWNWPPECLSTPIATFRKRCQVHRVQKNATTVALCVTCTRGGIAIRQAIADAAAFTSTVEPRERNANLTIVLRGLRRIRVGDDNARHFRFTNVFCLDASGEVLEDAYTLERTGDYNYRRRGGVNMLPIALAAIILATMLITLFVKRCLL